MKNIIEYIGNFLIVVGVLIIYSSLMVGVISIYKYRPKDKCINGTRYTYNNGIYIKTTDQCLEGK